MKKREVFLEERVVFLAEEVKRFFFGKATEGIGQERCFFLTGLVKFSSKYEKKKLTFIF